ncbi:MAG TPA: hypothetical protein VK753_12465 [Xanthomonadaceae bacterium]|jgi:hypothetical protein|nr:hypothetical protein [Xanthomonadaceae bacterium]
MRMRPTATLVFAASCLAAGIAHAHPGDLNRCVGPDGRSVFTDKPCDEVGASVRIEPPKDTTTPGSQSTVHVHVHDCARTAQALRDGLQAALVAGDVNKVAALYHWPGIGVAEAEDILKRMQILVARPFVAVELLRRRNTGDAEGDRAATSATSMEASAIDIAQTRSANDPTPMHTVLALTPYMGCWWVRF